MSERTVITCEACDIQKKETNRWWKVKEMTTHLRIFKAEVKVPKPYKDVCGQVCVHRLVDRWMESRPMEKVEEPAAEVPAVVPEVQILQS